MNPLAGCPLRYVLRQQHGRMLRAFCRACQRSWEASPSCRQRRYLATLRAGLPRAPTQSMGSVGMFWHESSRACMRERCPTKQTLMNPARWRCSGGHWILHAPEGRPAIRLGTSENQPNSSCRCLLPLARVVVPEPLKRQHRSRQQGACGEVLARAGASSDVSHPTRVRQPASATSKRKRD